MIKVAVNGYGTIGKRVADAVSLQRDMKLVGVSKTKPDYVARSAISKGYKIFTDNLERFEEEGIEAAGTIEDMIDEADVIIDCTPNGVGEKNKELYLKYGKKAVFQGGEKASVAEASFVAQVNYLKAFGRDYVRVVSCNTTGLTRTLHVINEKLGIKFVKASLIRRSADPWDTEKGPINAIEISGKSHHVADVKTIIPNLDIKTSAFKVPTTLMHVHDISIMVEREVTGEKLLDILEENKRTWIADDGWGLKSTAQLIECAREIGRPRNDIYEVVVWDKVEVDGKWVFLRQAVHQEAIVIPENIDAVRAMFQLTSDPLESIEETDRTLGVINGKIPLLPKAALELSQPRKCPSQKIF